MSFRPISLVLLCGLLLTGCGSTPITTQEVIFENYQIQIPDAYTEVKSGLIENKQILNKVLKSYKKSSEKSFKPNIIITKSILPVELDYEQYRTANSSKLRQYLAGYIPGTQEVIHFNCGETDIPGILVQFQVTDTTHAGVVNYHVAQYQRVNGEQGYIISIADPESTDLLKSWLKSLQCIS